MAPHRSISHPLIAAALLATTACGPNEPPPPNVLLITLDTTRADHLSCYGYEKETTPNIDALAAAGARFEVCISTAGLTPMSHASILSGLNNYRHGLRAFHSEGVGFRLDEGVETLPVVLARYGYRTGATVSSYPVSEFFRLNRGFEHFDTGLDIDSLDLTRQQKHEDAWVEAEKSATQRRGDFTVSQAIDWLESAPSGEPWCLWVHMFDVHDASLVPPAEWIAQHGIEYDRSVKLQDIEWRERMYDPELTFMDEQIGRVVAWLKAHDQWENTVIVVTADHGQGLTDGLERHQWVKHRLLYEWSIRVPLIVRVPGEPPVAVDGLVRTIDIMPTLLDLLGLPAPDLEGRSLLGLMHGGEEQPRIAYADALNLLDAHSPGRGLPELHRDNLFCVRDARWKLIWHQEHEENAELFDLENDPLELKNVAGEHPDQLRRLKAFLDERDAMKFRPPTEEADGPSADALKQLGYTGDDPLEGDEDANQTAPNEADDGDGR